MRSYTRSLQKLGLLFLCLLAVTVTLRAETQTLYYPTKDEAMFSIVAPTDWEVTSIKEVGEFAALESPNGSILQFRAEHYDTNKEAKKAVDSIFDETGEFLSKTYRKIKLDDPEKLEGELTGVQLTGSGEDKDGNPVVFISAMVVLDDKTIAEVWGAVFADEKEDLAKARKILGSFKNASE